MAKKRKAKPKVRETDPDEFEEDEEEGWYEDPKEGEVEPPIEPVPDERPPNPIPPAPKASITWLGRAGDTTERQSKIWHGIVFEANKPVPIDHLPRSQQESMIKDCEGSKAWKVTVADPAADAD